MAVYTGSSIVDYLKSTGQDSSYAARKKLATDLGISGYSGTAAQNTQLLNSLRNQGTATSKVATPTVTATPAQTAASQKVAETESQWGPLSPGYAEAIKSGTEADYLKGVDKLVSDTPVSSGNSSLPNVSGLSNINFNAAPATYADPYSDKINAALDKILNYNPAPYNDPYADEISALLNKILAYDPNATYDVTQDAQYNPLKTQYETAGEKAFQDTIGDLAAMTGGRANTWATSAASQAKNKYAQEFEASVLPSLINQEMSRRQNTYNNLVNQLNELQGLSEVSYGRNKDATENQYNNILQQLEALTGLSDNSYSRNRDTVADTGMVNGNYTQSGKINQQAIEQNEQANLANQAATIAAANYENIQAEINRRASANPNDPLIPYLQAERQKKIANEASATSATAAQQYKDALDMWERSGTASAEVARILGLPVGAKTADYNIDLMQANTSRMNAETARANAGKAASNASTFTDTQILNMAKDMINQTVPAYGTFDEDNIYNPTNPLTDADGNQMMKPKYTRKQIEEWISNILPATEEGDKAFDDIVKALWR